MELRQTRLNYWSLSKLAYYIKAKLGVKNMEAATWPEWAQWKKDYKERHPNWYWITEEFLDKLQDIVYFIPDMLNSIRYYIKNRFVSKTHYIRTGLKPGEWWELETRILNGLFNELVDFVEVDKAWMLVVWDDVASKKYSLPWWARSNIFRFWEFRSAEAGLEYLMWEANLEDSPTQAATAREIMFLYDWWKNIRPNRIDPYDLPAYSKAFKNKDFLAEINDEEKIAIDETLKLEEKYDKEDEEMLLSLIKIRKSLWT